MAEITQEMRAVLLELQAEVNALWEDVKGEFSIEEGRDILVRLDTVRNRAEEIREAVAA